MVRRVLITVGGTGGHIYPATALAKKLKEKFPDIYIAFAGGGLKGNPFFDRQAFPYHEIACGYFPLKHPMKCLKSFGRIAAGLWQSKKVIKDYKPDIIIGFGSYHSLPTLLTAKLHGIPILLHEANTIPGKVNRLLSRHALATCVHFIQSSEYLNGKTIAVGMPLREGMVKGHFDKASCLEYFGLESGRNTLLVMGGSQGAFAINSLMFDVFKHYRGEKQKLQVLHLTGRSEETEKMKKYYAENGIFACVKDYEISMEKAWTSADLVIGRAGAGTIAEEVEFETPGILIPYPYAADDHQSKNADYMVQTVKGAHKYTEKNLNPKVVAEKLYDLFDENKDELRGLKESIAAYKAGVEQYDFCSLINELIPV